MKHLWTLAVLMMVLAGCGGSAAPSGGRCNKGLCVKIEVAEPIRWGEPIVITVDFIGNRNRGILFRLSTRRRKHDTY